MLNRKAAPFYLAHINIKKKKIHVVDILFKRQKPNKMSNPSLHSCNRFSFYGCALARQFVKTGESASSCSNEHHNSITYKLFSPQAQILVLKLK